MSVCVESSSKVRRMRRLSENTHPLIVPYGSRTTPPAGSPIRRRQGLETRIPRGYGVRILRYEVDVKGAQQCAFRML